MIPKIHQDVDYSIDKDNRKVTAQINLSVKIFDSYVMTHSTGIAKCHPDDNWNEVLGKRIAESRATQKVMKKLKIIILHQLTDLFGKFDTYIDLLGKVNDILGHEVDHEIILKMESE